MNEIIIDNNLISCIPKEKKLKKMKIMEDDYILFIEYLTYLIKAGKNKIPIRNDELIKTFSYHILF